LDKKELQAAFKGSGLIIPKSKFEQFFSEIDTDHDGAISFDEWRCVLNIMAALRAYLLTAIKNLLTFHSCTKP